MNSVHNLAATTMAHLSSYGFSEKSGTVDVENGKLAVGSDTLRAQAVIGTTALSMVCDKTDFGIHYGIIDSPEGRSIIEPGDERLSPMAAYMLKELFDTND